MLISKKLIHFFNTINLYKFFDINHKLSFFAIVSLFKFIKIFIVNSNIFENSNLTLLNNKYKNMYNIKLKTMTKYLFLFTSYIIYSKLNNIVNLFFFKFNLLSKKQKKFTILRAPCNHKNSKEQYGLTKYQANIKGNMMYIKNNFYNNFFFTLLSDKKLAALTEFNKKYEKRHDS